MRKMLVKNENIKHKVVFCSLELALEDIGPLRLLNVDGLVAEKKVAKV